MTAALAERPRQQRTRFLRPLLALLLIMVALPLLLAGAVWAYGPSWIAPVEDFSQGPGGAVAYISLLNQLTSQSPQLYRGREVKLEMSEAEFSGMLSSALLSGRGPASPIRKVRGSLPDGEIRVETILQLRLPALPERFSGPVGLKLRLSPEASRDGLLRFRITRAAVGRIPVPVWAIRWAGRTFDLQAPGFDAGTAVIEIPISNMVTSQIHRTVEFRQIQARDGKLTMVFTANRMPALLNE